MNLLLFGGLALAQEAASPPSPQDDIAAVLIGLTGTGWLTIPGQEPLPLDRCVGVPLGATICTEEDSFATIRLAPDPATPGAEDVVLLPLTCLDIEEATHDRAALTMRSGGVAVAEDEDDQGELAVRTRDGTTAGSSGGFRVTLEDRATRAEAVTGQVQVRSPLGGVALPPGTGSRLRAEAAPEQPQGLLRPQALLAPADQAPLRRPDFAWEPVAYSTGYRVELAANPGFTDIVESIDVPGASWEPELLFVPTRIEGLWWRVSAYDRFGYLGVPTSPRFLELPGGVQ